MWRLVSFVLPWLVLALVVARSSPLQLDTASYITYPLAAIPILVLDAVVVTVQALRAGRGPDASYLRWRFDDLTERRDAGVRGWLRPAGS